ncbi:MULTISPECIES: nitrous oxide reductase accessory protein NosL [Rhizobium]|jgi:copper chaperone NosL|uniref:nitrous oxide reductase accessory protein NosL n=1 Tax=Rhizobium TaxID=379 RepID=UPI00163B0363|nr:MULTISPECIES: nitrous oxide reductase accessory protein NosL [Rhizobium]MBC2775856.1 nitrous oxide reductase accessory protein NosL [Rhizobium sp. AQ_MP]MDR7030791.1 copper chaperone NosL [Rhizobium rosettiformans]MDR7062588.1 copper chaperone NosL [Rhizobium rosettiformans]
MTSSLRSLIIVGSLVLLVACQENAVQDIKPKDMTAETLGHYCQMNLLEHSGPKGQVFLEGMPAPLFFSQVRDAIAYMRGPEQMAPILAVYVNDMGAPGATWEKPGDGNWIAIDEALFVVGSNRQGGMGAPETIPFTNRQKAEKFARAEGGRVLSLNEITDDMVLAPVSLDDGSNPQGDDVEFQNRLRALSIKSGG